MNRTHREDKSFVTKTLGISLLLCGAVLPSVQVVAETPAAPLAIEKNAPPTKLDYVVLASLADTSSLLSLSAYRAPAAVSADEPNKAPAATDPRAGE